MKSSFFDRNKENLQFNWNNATQHEWAIIRRNFVAAYIKSYMDRSFEELQYKENTIDAAKAIWDTHYVQGYDTIVENIIKPLQFYLNFEKEPLNNELNEIKCHFENKLLNITTIKQYLIKLILLKNYFENDFQEEKEKIDAQHKKINYLIMRFNDRPIGFFVSEYNIKSAHVYLRFVTLAPAFHQLGLGTKAIEAIANYYPEATGLELYTRKANIDVQQFYQHCGFEPATDFNFDQPILSLTDETPLCFPEDDKTDNKKAFIAFCKPTHRYHG